MDKNGYIDFSEFVTACTNYKSFLDKDEYLKIAFSHYDLDGNGKITLDEIK